MIHFYSACMAGPYHIDNNIPCQDSRYIVARDDGIVVAACADGLGSEMYSDIGSQIASYTAVTYCAEHLNPDMTTEKILKLIKVSFVNAYKAVIDKATDMNEDIDQFDTTLCLAIYDGETVWYGHSGDSGLVVRFNIGHYHPVTTQQRDEDGCVYPLCSGPDHWVIGKVDGSVSSLMLMTDGVWEQVCHPLLRNEEVKVNTSLIKPFMERTETDQAVIDEVESACVDYLEHFPRERLDDDKTVVVVYNTDNPAAKMPVEYYLYPDWDLLNEKSRTTLSMTPSCTQTTHSCPQNTAVQDHNNREPLETPVEVATIQDAAEDDAENPSSDDEEGHPQTEVKPPTCNNRRSKRGKQRKPDEATKNKKDTNKRKVKSKPCSKKMLDIISILVLVVFSLISFFMQDLIQKYAPVSYFGVFLVCFIANASVLLPAPSILIVVQYSLILNPLLTAFCGAVGSAIGEMVGYLAGAHCGNLLSAQLRKKVLSVMPKHPYLLVFCFSLIPLPIFDVVGILAGSMKLSQAKFFLSCALGKIIKMVAFAWMANYIVQFLV